MKRTLSLLLALCLFALAACTAAEPAPAPSSAEPIDVHASAKSIAEAAFRAGWIDRDTAAWFACMTAAERDALADRMGLAHTDDPAVLAREYKEAVEEEGMVSDSLLDVEIRTVTVREVDPATLGDTLTQADLAAAEAAAEATVAYDYRHQTDPERVRLQGKHVATCVKLDGKWYVVM